MRSVNRRELLRASLALLANCSANAAPAAGLSAAAVKASPSRLMPVDPNDPGANDLVLSRDWTGAFCQSKITNRGKSSVRLREIILFSIAHQLPPETRLYGESFQMLSQSAGTLAKPVDLGYSELQHYKLPQPEGVRAFSGMLTLTPPEGETALLAFTSCRRFNGRFYSHDGVIDVVVDTEGLALAPGESWHMEAVTFDTSSALACSD